MKIFVVPTGAYQTNCYIFECGDNNAIIVDPGAQANKIEDELKKHNLTVKHILLTHEHWDHIGAVAHFQKSGAKVYMSKEDASLLKEDFASGDYESIPKFTPDQLVGEGDTLSLGNKDIKVIHTPGHTAGCVCYIVEDSLFSGDTLFQRCIGRTDLPTGDHKTILVSLKRLVGLDKNYCVYPGHGDSTSIEDERRYNPYV